MTAYILLSFKILNRWTTGFINFLIQPAIYYKFYIGFQSMLILTKLRAMIFHKNQENKKIGLFQA